jgi:YbgC/YbaW family acyl-CoA thioester hydrolase
MSLSPPRTLETYPCRAVDVLRFADTDRVGHVNNAAFATFCESGRVALLYDPKQPLAPAGTNFVIARLVLDFRAEINYPGTVEIGTAVARVGRSSATLHQADEDHCNRQKQKDMDESAKCVAGHHTQEPQQSENDSNRPEHTGISFAARYSGSHGY